MGVSECSVGVPPAKCGSFGHKTIVLHRRDARATLFCRYLFQSDFFIGFSDWGGLHKRKTVERNKESD
jgi:hypothetical protein